jgi:hypothetical protein
VHPDKRTGLSLVVLSLSDVTAQKINVLTICTVCNIYDGRLRSSWTHLITPSRKFVEVRWRSLFRSTFLGKRCTSYNAPPTSRKRASDRQPQASGGQWNSMTLPPEGIMRNFFRCRRLFVLPNWWLLLGFWIIVPNPRFITSDYGTQNSVTQRWRSSNEISISSAILKRVLLKRP